MHSPPPGGFEVSETPHGPIRQRDFRHCGLILVEPMLIEVSRTNFLGRSKVVKAWGRMGSGWRGTMGVGRWGTSVMRSIINIKENNV